VFKQVDYDYQRMQYNTVVSGAMKLLNALEDFKRRWIAGDAAAQRMKALASCCAPVPGDAAHDPRPVAGAGLRRTHGDLLDAPWPAVDEGGAQAGRDRTHAAGQRQAARLHPVPAGADKTDRAAALASEVFIKLAEGARPRR
jgi:leucyl-tRNA synthetase